MVVMPDGKLVVVGTATLTDAALKSVVLARFTTDDPEPEPEPEVNHDPLASLMAPTSGVRGFALSFVGMFSDEDLTDTHMVSWDFGDGTVLDFQSAEDALNAVHTYAASGQYTVTFTVKDQHGATSSATATVSIAARNVHVVSVSMRTSKATSLVARRWTSSPIPTGTKLSTSANGAIARVTPS